MKKIIMLSLSLVMAITIFAGCAQQKSSTDSNVKPNVLEKIKKDGKITFGLDDSYPPMEFRDEKNNLVGFDIDLGNEIAKKIGVKAEFVTTDFNGIILALKSEKFHGILSAMSVTEKRKEEISFAGPYIEGGQIIAVKSSNDKIKSSKDLVGAVVGCQLGSTGEEAAAKLQGLKEVKKYDKITEAFHDLEIGRLEAVVVDAQVGGYYISKESTKYKVLDEKLTKEPQGIGLKKEDKELKTAIDKALDDLKKEGTLSKLSTKWFGMDIYK